MQSSLIANPPRSSLRDYFSREENVGRLSVEDVPESKSANLHSGRAPL